LGGTERGSGLERGKEGESRGAKTIAFYCMRKRRRMTYRKSKVLDEEKGEQAGGKLRGTLARF